MGIRFILMVNKQGQTRLAQYYEYLTLEERRALEAEIVRKCLARTEQQVSASSSAFASLLSMPAYLYFLKDYEFGSNSNYRNQKLRFFFALNRAFMKYEITNAQLFNCSILGLHVFGEISVPRLLI